MKKNSQFEASAKDFHLEQLDSAYQDIIVEDRSKCDLINSYCSVCGKSKGQAEKLCYYNDPFWNKP